jgi:sensor histidine kinase regulating citrate/malate metabolism
VALLLINVITFALYDAISKTEQELYEKKILEQQNIAYNNQIKLWKDNQKATQTLKHDMKNHLIELKTTLANGDYQKLDKYISTMMSSLEVREEYVKSGNVSVDSILNYKLKEIKSLTDNVTYSITIPSDIFVSAFDLNIILGNLLDNSIEALVKCNNSARVFNFQMEYAQGIIKISVENSYEGQVHQQNNTFKTTKSDSNLHGIGIESVKNTIAKYNGIIQFDTDGAIFKVKILLCEDDFKV